MIKGKVNLKPCAMNIHFMSIYLLNYSICHLIKSKDQLLEDILNIKMLIPNKDEHPGPPFNQSVTGSVLFAPFADYTKT